MIKDRYFSKYRFGSHTRWRITSKGFVVKCKKDDWSSALQLGYKFVVIAPGVSSNFNTVIHCPENWLAV